MNIQQRSRKLTVLATMSGSSVNLLLTSIQAVILVPLYLHTIGPRIYGAWLGSGDILQWLQAVDLVLPLMIQRIGIAHSSGDKQALLEYFISGLLISVAVGVVIILVAMRLSYSLPTWMGLQGSDAQTLQNCFQIGALAVALQMINSCAFGLSLGVQDTAIISGVRILSTLVGLVVSLWLILTGWGLWAVVLGMLARSATGFIGSSAYVINYLYRESSEFSFRLRRSILQEFILVSPAVALGNLGYAMMNQSESAIVAILIKPELATVLTLTRKAIEIVQALVDMIGFSAYGSLSHLAASEQRHRTLRVYAEIASLRLSTAVALGSAYMAINSSLVSLWVGNSQYGGTLLTILMAMRMIIVGNSYLMNYLYRAIGSVMRGAVALLAESIIRISLMICGLLLFGLPGLPIAGMITAGGFGLLAYRWTIKETSSYAESPVIFYPNVWIARVTVFCIGMLACLFLDLSTWIGAFTVGALVAIVGGLIMFYLDPLLDNTRVVLLVVLEHLHIIEITQKMKLALKAKI